MKVKSFYSVPRAFQSLGLKLRIAMFFAIAISFSTIGQTTKTTRVSKESTGNSNAVLNSTDCSVTGAAPSLSIAKADPSCSNISDGSINLSIAGGVGPFTHLWSLGGETSEDLTNLAYGSYTVITTGSNGCSDTLTTKLVAANKAPVVISAITNASCEGVADGGINLSVDGIGPFTYSWSPGGASTEDLTGVTSGTYSVSVTGSGGCTTVLSGLTINASGTQLTACPDPDNDGFGDPSNSITYCSLSSTNASTNLIADGSFEIQAVTQSLPSYQTGPGGQLWGRPWNAGWSSGGLASSWRELAGGGAWSGNAAICRTEDFGAGWKWARTGVVFGIIKENGNLSQTFTATSNGTGSLNWFDANRASWREHDWFGRPHTYNVTLTDNLGNVQELGTYTSEVAGGSNYTTPPGGYGWWTDQGKKFWFARTSLDFNLVAGRNYTLSFNSLVTDDDRTTFLDDISISMRSPSSIPPGYVSNCDCIVGDASSSPTLCINTILTDITHTSTGTTGIGTATGLPAGVSASWANNLITISGAPTESGTFNYSIPLTGGCGSLSATGTITVIAPGSESVEDPQFSSGTGSYSSLQYVSLSTATPGAEIYYTTNGNLPLFDVPNSFTQLYTGPITVAQTTKIYSVARLACATSLIKFAEYTFAVPLIVSTPVITPGTGTYAGAQTVTISVSTPDADIYYTTTGNEPVIGTVFTKLYTGPFILNGDATVRAMGVKSGMGNSSVAVAYLTFSSTTPICATPVISPATGSYTSPQTVNITCSTPGSTIYYTTNGNEPLLNPFPNSFTSVFSSSFPLSGSGEITIRAMATAPGFMPSSVEVSVITLSGGTPRQAVDQNISAQELVVSPNPSSGRFFISIPAEYYQEAMSLQVLNTAGKLISNRSVKAEGSEMISLEDQPQGIYLLKVQTGGMQKTFRLVKN
jgi:hypothetical protein